MGKKNNYTGLTPWVKGDKLQAAHWQEIVTLLNRLQGILPGFVFNNPGINPLSARMFKVVELAEDIIICHTWDGAEEGEDDIAVARPYLLRKTPFDGQSRGDFSFVYEREDKRVSTNLEDETEDQILVDSYDEGEVIFALNGIQGGTDLLDDNEEVVQWVDMNFDGRYWAQDDDPENS